MLLWYGTGRVIGQVLLLVLALALPVTSQDDTEPTATPSTPYRIDMRDHGTAMSVEWSPNGEMLAIGGSRGIWLYSDDFTEIAHLESEFHEVTSVSWSPDSTMLASASIASVHDSEAVFGTRIISSVWIWNVETRELVKQIDTAVYTPVVWHPTTNLFAEGNYVGEVRVFDAITGDEKFLFQAEQDHAFQNSANSLCWSSDGASLIAIFEYDIYVLDPNSADVVQHHVGGGRNLDCSPSRLVLADAFGCLINLETDSWDCGEADSSDGYSVTWSPDGSAFATNSSDRTVKIYDGTTAEVVRVLEGGMNFGSGVVAYYHDSLDWNSDGTRLVAASEDGLVRIWDTENYQLIAVLEFEPIWSGNQADIDN